MTTTKHPLVGRAITFQSAGRQVGTFAGIVRLVTLTRATKGTKKKPGRVAVLKTVTVQRPGGEAMMGGGSYSARCGGKRLRLEPDQVRGVYWHGKMRPLAEFLETRLRIEARKADE